jgi:acid-sensing ion channel, other
MDDQLNDENPFQQFDGYRVIVHDNDELPSYSGQQFLHAKHYDTDIHLAPHVFLIDVEVKKMSIERRQCYLQHEKSLKFFKVYTKKNCEIECLSSMMVRTCGCVPFYVISKNAFCQ